MEGGAFDEEDRYFDVFAEYAKASPNGVLIRITIANRGPQREWKKTVGCRVRWGDFPAHRHAEPGVPAR